MNLAAIDGTGFEAHHRSHYFVRRRAKGRQAIKPPSGYHRRMMRRYFERPRELRRYGQRWQVETVMSMIKRRLGETLAARSYRRQCRAMLLKVIAHNVLILLP